ncbi:hypothetical protein RRF57_010605 [Xylaria bambusicola]|uniref:Uncharacterized protein n=1 Tax=Xylaria bambusicola TaxID=326684 RepID=A0AAN7UWV8_9PEZI
MVEVTEASGGPGMFRKRCHDRKLWAMTITRHRPKPYEASVVDVSNGMVAARPSIVLMPYIELTSDSVG